MKSDEISWFIPIFSEAKRPPVAMRALGALAVSALWRRGAADGACAVGWTLIDDACFKVTEGQGFWGKWMREVCGGFHSHGGIQKWMVSSGKSH